MTRNHGGADGEPGSAIAQYVSATLALSVGTTFAGPSNQRSVTLDHDGLGLFERERH